MEYQYTEITDQGGKKENQDFIAHQGLKSGHQIFIIADGLGGHKGGYMASRLAVDSVLECAKNNFQFSHDGLVNLQNSAQKTLQENQENNPQLQDMRTTLVILVIAEDKALWLHCGDSRLYLFRDDEIIARTVDHSLASVLYLSGEIEYDAISKHSDRNVLLRCIGNSETETRYSVSKEVFLLQPGDRFLLCTDGFWEFIHEQEMISLWQNDLPDWLASMRTLVINRGDEQQDNYTACAIQIVKVIES